MDLNLTADQITNALNYAWDTLDLEADMDADLDNDVWKDAMCCPECGKRECEKPDPAPQVVHPSDPIDAEVRATMREQERVWLEEFDQQIHEGFKIGDLRMAFDRVKRVDNWKMPIQAFISESQETITRVAVIFFTGSVPTFTPMGGGWLRVEADGYYKAVGA